LTVDYPSYYLYARKYIVLFNVSVNHFTQCQQFLYKNERLTAYSNNI
jgi:hypothetical protein